MDKEIYIHIHIGMPKIATTYLQNDLDKYLFKKKFQLPKDIKIQILELHELDNQKLDNELSLNLKKLGYY